MKRFGVLLLLALPLFTVRGADGPSAPPESLSRDDLVTALNTADSERVSATLAGDRSRLEAILSDELRFASWNGKVDNKNSLIDSLAGHSTVYDNFEYKGRTIRSVASGVALMTGRAVAQLHSGDQKESVDMNFLAIWRLEDGRWRLFAWQSCPNQ